MANIKTTQKEWDIAREYFEAGLSLSMIEKKTGISRSSLSKKSNADGWSKETGKDILIQKDIDVKLAKETLNETALLVHDELVNERTEHIKFFNHAALLNVKQSLEMPCESQNDFKARAETISKGRADVLGKTPDTQVNIQNNTFTRIERVIVDG